MADLKISQLTGATTPLDGTEVLPIVQSSSTKKVATNDLTVKNIRSNATSGILQIAGPAASATRTMTVPDANFTAARIDAAQSFTGDQTLGTGNLIQGTAAKGINFTANTGAAGKTSQLLNWYEEGTWTATLSDGTNNATMGQSTCYYTRVGRMVTIHGYIYTTSLGSVTGNLVIKGLPFVVAAGTTNYTAATAGLGDSLAIGAGQSVSLRFTPNSNVINLFLWDATTGSTAMQDTEWTANGELMFSASYLV